MDTGWFVHSFEISYDEPDVPSTKTKTKEKGTKVENYYQGIALAGESFYLVGETNSRLESGLYIPGHNNQLGYTFKKGNYSTQDLIRFEDSTVDIVIKEFDVFWTLKDEYKKRGEEHKRGYFMHGPPGGGKTSVVNQLVQEFIRDCDGMVFVFNDHTPEAVNSWRQIEPDRKLMVIMEDIDGMIRDPNLEQRILQFLDGATPLVNTVVVATTNYPERVPPRIKNRPSRFDRMIEVGYPTPSMREKYIKIKAFSDMFTKDKLKEIVKDTEDFSFAHIKELILAVEVYNHDYKETLDRLLEMKKDTVISDDYDKKGKGFGF